MKSESIVESTTTILNKINILCQEINQVDISTEAKSKLELVRAALIQFKHLIDLELSIKHQSLDDLPAQHEAGTDLMAASEKVNIEEECNVDSTVKNEVCLNDIKEEMLDADISLKVNISFFSNRGWGTH